ncbi:hypothetical protein ED733_002481 [Metarhizium rileyi]|uniref:N-terminal fungal transcription regulatory domain-containing protein n=1 Tax=Metarhizium rileyi (strain RCEF 4871) TaxID=1649241 RepID=A0A5C6G0A1_METRR|nr:hypothetical protein ED733_002481 [Metarhizium rileyi]
MPSLWRATAVVPEKLLPNETASTAIKRHVDQLQKELSEHADIIEHLRSVSELEAISVIRLLKSTPNASMVLASLRGGAHTAARISELKTSRGLLPHTDSETDFELSVLHKSVYPALMPLDLDSIDTRSLFSSSSPHDTANLTAPATAASTCSLAASPPSPLRGTRAPHTSRVAGPAPGRQHCDPRLSQLQMGYWTSIPISDDFAACVLSHYLESDHPIYACVDADLFLSDLANRRLEYCSPFLVNALMSFACQSYTQFDKRSSALSVAFIKEAQKLWRSEQRSKTPIHLAAMVYLSLASGVSGRDELAGLLAADCRGLAEKVSLFGVAPTEQSSSTFFCLPPDHIKSWAFAAWGAYAWLTIYYPSEPITSPPLLPIPGDSCRRTKHGSVLDWPPHPLPTYMGDTFQTLSKLWVLIQEINVLYNLAEKTPLEERVPLSYAESKYQGLLNWSDSLLPGMLHSEHSPTHVLFFHALFHSTVLSLFHPFQTSAAADRRLCSFGSADATPAAIYSASLNQLKRLIDVHHIRKPYLPNKCWFNTAIMRVSSELIKNAATDPDWYFYFRLCLSFWKDTYVSYRPFRLIAQANLAAALQSGALRSNVAVAMMEEISATGRHHVASDEAVIRGLLDFDRATKNLEEAQIVTVARRFDELILFDELINETPETAIGTTN